MKYLARIQIPVDDPNLTRQCMDQIIGDHENHHGTGIPEAPYALIGIKGSSQNLEVDIPLSNDPEKRAEALLKITNRCLGCTLRDKECYPRQSVINATTPTGRRRRILKITANFEREA